MAGANTDIFKQTKTINDYTQEDAINAFKQQLLVSKLATAGAGGNLPAPLQLANEYQKRLEAGDIAGANNIMVFAKAADKGLQVTADGTYVQAPNYAPAISGIEGAKAGAKELAQKQVDVQLNPVIAGGESGARLRQQLAYEPQIEVAKTDASGAVNDATANPLIKQLTDYNSKSFEMPYSGSTLGIARLNPNEDVQTKVKNTELLGQARLDLAAPLAKQLGVNPTDKDFQASLDRIFNLNSSQSSRQAQIDALAMRIQARKSARAQRQGMDPATYLFDNPSDVPGNSSINTAQPNGVIAGGWSVKRIK